MPFQWLRSSGARNIVRLLLKRVIKMVSLLLKRGEYFAGISTVLVTENECFHVKKETTRQCAYSVFATKH
jgi:hypothetical protein